MIEKILLAGFVILFALFLLSVFAPMHSQHPFWLKIHAFRTGMDRVVYGIICVCGILTLVHGIWVILQRLAGN